VTIRCKVCGADVHPYEYSCVRCMSAHDFPNVRKARTAREREALRIRAIKSRRAAKKAGASVELSRLLDMLTDATIAFNRDLAVLFDWCHRPDQMFKGWLEQVSNGRRIFPDEFNDARVAFEHNVNPNFSKEINFCYLDTGTQNLTEYGPYKVKFHSKAVGHRVAFLETNAYYFCRQHKVVVPSDIPAGRRATWNDRGLLVEAKLGGVLRQGMSDADLGKLLLRERFQEDPADFIEAHVYGALHLSAIETISGPPPSADDEAMWQSVRAKLRTVGAKLEIDP